ncbi:unnamed protein product [Arabis nemorensis]|uniref:Phospholipid/glycerol acyltransferase domain-containing protein n=1 Tax=Arabis nemorensis TaxID=586526 RepID=A0A565B7V9_9BRAS|nr:unnamed protein product [Arabis nemorensis]
MDTWRLFSSCKKRVVVTRMPRIMVEWFAKEHLRADEVIGTELIVNGFGFVTGLIREPDIDQSVLSRVGDLFVDQRPHLGIGRPAKMISKTFLSLCQEQIHAPVHGNHSDQQLELQPPKPVIFHDGRFVKRPTPATALLILLWMPFGIILAAIRICILYVLPFWAIPYVIGISGIRVTVKGKPPRLSATRNSGLLFVCNHKTFIDGIVLSYALGRKITSHSVDFRNRDIDAGKIKEVLSKGDVAIFPEGASFNEPFLLRFNALFAELTDEIVPVAMNGGTGLTVDSNAGFFRAKTRGWTCLNVFFFMNPTLVYEVTFLDQLPLEESCSSGKSLYDVANYVQRILADTLGFECTNSTRKDKYKLLT